MVEKAFDIIYGLFVTIDTVIYKFIGWLYQLFLVISSAKIFKTETFELVISRIYVILGIVMLFFLAYTALKILVDPDKNEVGSMGKVVSNIVIALVCIAIIPTVFSFLYQAQGILLTNNIIGKIVLGNYSSTVRRLDVKFDKEVCEVVKEYSGNVKDNEDGTCTASYAEQDSEDQDYTSVRFAGNSIAVDIFSAFYYPHLLADDYDKMEDQAESEATEVGDEDNVDDYTNSNQFYNAQFTYDEVNENKLNDKEKELYLEIASYDACHTMNANYTYGNLAQACADDFARFLEKDADDTEEIIENRNLNYKSILQYSKTTGDMDGFKLISNLVYEGRVDYSIIISLIGGIYICYIFINYCIDMGLRAVKLGFAQLVAPVPLLSRVIPNQSGTFNKWVTFTLTTYFEVFLRILVIYLGIFMITNLPSIQGMWDDSYLTNISIMSLRNPVLLLDINSASWGILNMARVAVIIGILTFVKNAPSLIGDALGINLNVGSLGIRNKLNNMLGGKTLMNAAGSVGGAASGAIGAGYMSLRHGGKEGFKNKDFLKAAVKGGREGFKNKGWQFDKQAQRAYHETTGSNYRGSYLSGGDSITGRAIRALDNNEKVLKDDNKARLQQIQKDYEEKNPEFANMVNTRMQPTIQAAEQIRKTALKDADTKRAQEKQNAERIYNDTVRAAEAAVTNAQNKVNEAQNYKRKASEEIQRNKEAFERSAEYQAIKERARQATRSEMEKGIQLTGTARDQKEQEVYNRHLAAEISKATSDAAKTYNRDLNRNLDQEEAQVKQKAQTELNNAKQERDAKKQKADQVFEDAKKSADRTFNNTAKMANKQYNATIENQTTEVIKDVRKEIIKNPQNKEQQRYADAVNIVGAKTDQEKIIEMLNKMNNNNSNSN